MIALKQIHAMGVDVPSVLGIGRARAPLQVLLAEHGRERSVVPVDSPGVVGAEAHSSAPHGLSDLAHKVVARPAHHRVAPVRPGRVPQGDAVVVLGRGDHQVRSRAGEEVGPAVRVEALGAPHVQERVVGQHPVGAPVVGLGGAAVDSNGVEVPLGVGVVREPGRLIRLGPQLAVRLRPGRHRVGAPVDEDSQHRAVEPLRSMDAQEVAVLGGNRSPHLSGPRRRRASRPSPAASGGRRRSRTTG